MGNKGLFLTDTLLETYSKHTQHKEISLSLPLTISCHLSSFSELLHLLSGLKEKQALGILCLTWGQPCALWKSAKRTTISFLQDINTCISVHHRPHTSTSEIIHFLWAPSHSPLRFIVHLCVTACIQECLCADTWLVEPPCCAISSRK